MYRFLSLKGLSYVSVRNEKKNTIPELLSIKTESIKKLSDFNF